MRTWPGELGFALVDLAFVAALVAAVALLWAWLQGSHTLQRLGRVAFLVHAAAVVGVFAVLLGIIITGQYQYHYAWKHASEELSLRFVVASIWEGQEGSFLIWMVWHALLGLALLRWGGRLTDGVLGIVASVQAILASMVLGVYFSEALSRVLFALAVFAPLGYLMSHFWRRSNPLAVYALGLVALLVGTNLVLGQTGFGLSLSNPIALLEVLFVGFSLALVARALHRGGWQLGPTLAAGLVTTLFCVLAFGGLGAWKVGSSPFLLLREALPDTPIFKTDPDFVPANGTGLNPLLQNYWMVIHPPTLFLGFALTLIPFAYLVAGLLKGDASGWVKPAGAWSLAAVGVLGVGILMGGYWAYETLNFGGYWNWDPVENASFVPWLTGVAGLHALLSYRHGQRNLKLAAGLIVATFVLVLYSTFLVRSGILGEASVHSFTDLGLSGQLLVLLLGYLLFIVILLAKRWKDLPSPAKPPQLLSRETFLLLAALVLTLAAAQIAVATSLPVINAIAGTNLAPPAHVPRYYYGWQVWFAAAIGLLSAVGQYIFWTRMDSRTLSKALFGPFVTAAVLTLVAMVTLHLVGREFVYNEPFRESFEATRSSGSWLQTAWSGLGTGLLFLADELLLFGALFAVCANAVVLVRLVRRSAKTQGKVGGSLAHIGFGMLLIGVVFSSGYEKTVSINLTPGELGQAFPDEAKADNVLLLKGQPKAVPGFEVRYAGKEVAEAPIGPLRVLLANQGLVKVAFEDRRGNAFAVEVPRSFFELLPAKSVALSEQGAEPTAEELAQLHTFIENNLRLIEPPALDGRTRYPITFVPLRRAEGGAAVPDSSRRFELQPEAEVNEGMGLIAHPATHHTLWRDLYVFVSSIPAEEDSSDQRLETRLVRLAVGDTANLGPYTLQLTGVVRVTDVPEFQDYDVVARAKVQVQRPEGSLELTPTFIVEGNQPRHIDARAEQLGLTLRFEGVAPEEGKIVLIAQQEIAPLDYITFKALNKPLILLVWLGAGIMTVGFAVATLRRRRELHHATE